MVAWFGVGAAAAVVPLPVATGPAIVLGCLGVKRSWRNAGLGFEICELDVELGNIEQGSDKLFVDSSEFECQFAIGGTECGNSLSTACSGSCEVGNGVYHILLVDGIGGLVAGSRRRDFGLTKFAMAEGAVTLEMFPSLVSFWMAFPDFAVIEEHAGRIDKLIGGGDDLFGRVRSVSGCSKIDCIFDLIEQGFDGEVGVISGFKGHVVFLKIGG